MSTLGPSPVDIDELIRTTGLGYCAARARPCRTAAMPWAAARLARRWHRLKARVSPRGTSPPRPLRRRCRLNKRGRLTGRLGRAP
ncbi:MAG: hypothetical protein ACXWJN_00335 [Methyloceanibacter sp.]